MTDRYWNQVEPKRWTTEPWGSRGWITIYVDETMWWMDWMLANAPGTEPLGKGKPERIIQRAVASMLTRAEHQIEAIEAAKKLLRLTPAGVRGLVALEMLEAQQAMLEQARGRFREMVESVAPMTRETSAVPDRPGLWLIKSDGEDWKVTRVDFQETSELVICWADDDADGDATISFKPVTEIDPSSWGPRIECPPQPPWPGWSGSIETNTT